jgi:type I restriction enzyme M protein
MESCVVFCRTTKPAERRGKVLLIDAVNEVTKDKTVSQLLPEHQARIAGAYTAFRDEDHFAAVATFAEIAGNGHSLSIPLYVRRPFARAATFREGAPTLAESWSAWETGGRAFWLEMDAVVDLLDGLAKAGEVADG